MLGGRGLLVPFVMWVLRLVPTRCHIWPATRRLIQIESWTVDATECHEPLPRNSPKRGPVILTRFSPSRCIHENDIGPKGNHTASFGGFVLPNTLRGFTEPKPQRRAEKQPRADISHPGWAQSLDDFVVQGRADGRQPPRPLHSPRRRATRDPAGGPQPPKLHPSPSPSASNLPTPPTPPPTPPPTLPPSLQPSNSPIKPSEPSEPNFSNTTSKVCAPAEAAEAPPARRCQIHGLEQPCSADLWRSSQEGVRSAGSSSSWVLPPAPLPLPTVQCATRHGIQAAPDRERGTRTA